MTVNEAEMFDLILTLLFQHHNVGFVFLVHLDANYCCELFVIIHLSKYLKNYLKTYFHKI